MSVPPRTDFWQVGLVPAPISTFVNPQALVQQRDAIIWLPDPGPWRYLADPFALQRGDATHVFVEAFDYRTKHAVIEHHELGPRFEWQKKSVVLSQPFHLSYPFLVEAYDETFMIPESQRAGEIALYRAKRFPDRWERETALLPNVADGLKAAGKTDTGYDRMIEMKVSFDNDPARALDDTRHWAALALTPEEKVSVHSPVEMERLAAELPVERAASRWIVSSDPDEHIEKIRPYIELGFNHLVFHAPGPDQDRFLRLYAAQVLPKLRQRFG